jgi:hypothetical protein
MNSAPVADGALSGSGRKLKARSSSRRHCRPQVSHRTLPPPPARLRRLAAALHALGARPLYEYLVEVADGADRLSPPRIIDGGRR